MEKTITPIIVDAIDGHLILFCKGHYKTEDLLVGLRRIWAVRCGLENQYVEHGQADTHIADHMYELVEKIRPNRGPWIIQRIHKDLGELIPFLNRYKDVKPIEGMISIYISEINCAQVNTHDENDVLIPIIPLPKAKKRLFNRILRGKGEYDDYKLITK